MLRRCNHGCSVCMCISYVSPASQVALVDSLYLAALGSQSDCDTAVSNATYAYAALPCNSSQLLHTTHAPAAELTQYSCAQTIQMCAAGDTSSDPNPLQIITTRGRVIQKSQLPNQSLITLQQG
jgi:hypothetical protein